MEPLDSKIASEALEVANDSESRQFLTFSLGKEEFGVDIITVSEIKAWSKPTRLPNVPHYLQGVVNLRGIIVPVVDLRARFGMEPASPTEKNVVIFLSINDKIFGILVDNVSDIANISTSNICHAPKIEGDVKDEYVEGLVNNNGQMIVLLNIERLFLDTISGVKKAV